ncbi:lactose permease [Colletotrichum graminicola]|nr:lactose permease [Colletotrichum graminicola]
MGFLKPSTTEKSKPDAQAVGSDLLAVLPEIPTPWYRTKHLLLLNLILLIPVLSSAAVGFDAFIFIYYFFHDIAWTPLLMAYPVEIFPYILLLASFCNPIGLATLGWKYYIVFCILLTLLLFLIWLPFPETKGRTLQQIAEIFDGKNHRLGACGIGEGKADDAKVQEVEDYADTEA